MRRHLMIPALFLAVWLSAAPAAGREDAVLSDMEFDRSTPARMTPVCGFPDLAIPPEAKIYAVGGYRGGRNLGWRIGHGFRPTALSQVAVNSPDAPVVLLLGAYESTVWEVGWTEGTVILAVLVSGNEAQGLSGLPPWTKTLVSYDYPDYGPCPAFYITGEAAEGVKRADELALKAFQRRPDEYLNSTDLEYLVAGRPLAAGQKVLMAQTLVREDLELPGSGLTGRAALEAMVRAGVISPASDADIDRWRETKNRRRRLLSRSEGQPSADGLGLAGLNTGNTFVISDERRVFCPEGLPEPAAFLLPPGLRAPKVRLDKCLLLLNDGMCRGQGCPR